MKRGSVHEGPLVSAMPRRLGESKNQEVDRARAKMQHQDQQELHNYGGPQQYTSRVYSDETRLTQGAARPGLSDCQAAAWTIHSEGDVCRMRGRGSSRNSSADAST